MMNIFSELACLLTLNDQHNLRTQWTMLCVGFDDWWRIDEGLTKWTPWNSKGTKSHDELFAWGQKDIIGFMCLKQY